MALETISNASDASLHSHAEQTIRTFRKISQRLRNLSPGFQATSLDPRSSLSPPKFSHNVQVAKMTTLREQAGRSDLTSPQRIQVTGFGDHHASPEGGPGVLSPSKAHQLSQAAETTAVEDKAVFSSLQTSHVSGLEVPLTPSTVQSIPTSSSAGARPERKFTPPDHIPQLLKCLKNQHVLFGKKSAESH